MVTRHHTVDHAERERRRRVDRVAEIEELARLLEADDPGITKPGPACEYLLSGSPNIASSAAIVRSQNIASAQPAPSAWPCTEASTGLRMYQGISSSARLVPSRS